MSRLPAPVAITGRSVRLLFTYAEERPNVRLVPKSKGVEREHPTSASIVTFRDTSSVFAELSQCPRELNVLKCSAVAPKA
jgi:hypothetical protein